MAGSTLRGYMVTGYRLQVAGYRLQVTWLHGYMVTIVRGRVSNELEERREWLNGELLNGKLLWNMTDTRPAIDQGAISPIN